MANSAMSSTRMRILSGIQPSGTLHLGNYFGAIREHVRLQEDGEGYYFVANYHALTTVRDPEVLRSNTLETALTYLACGIDPSRSVLYLQSDVPEVAELTWLLMAVNPMSLFNKATSFKDKIERGISPDVGLFTYPALMASDILVQDSDIVPVGKDQKQHLEMTRFMAERFNHTFGTEALKLPEYRESEVPYVKGLDGSKMSKSYGNTIGIFEEGKPLRKKIMSIKTDSTPVEEPKDPTTCTVYGLYAMMATKDEAAALAERYRSGGMGYGEAKQALYEKMMDYFEPMRCRRAELSARPDEIRDILAAGAAKARGNAQAVVGRARKACGLE